MSEHTNSASNRLTELRDDVSEVIAAYGMIKNASFIILALATLKRTDDALTEIAAAVAAAEKMDELAAQCDCGGSNKEHSSMGLGHYECGCYGDSGPYTEYCERHGEMSHDLSVALADLSRVLGDKP